MRRQLDVVVGHLVNRLLHDGAAVDEMADRHQHIINSHRMIGAEQQVARGKVVPERTGADADGWDFGALVTEPDDARDSAGDGGKRS